MSFDLTTNDKGRWETLLADGRWHSLVINTIVAWPIPAGDGWIQVDLFGDKGVGTAVLWLRFQRYPELDSTAWVSLTLDGALEWGSHHQEHMTFKLGETYGVDYRLEKGAPQVRLYNRILKGNHA